MKTRTWMLIGTLLGLPALALSQQPPEAKPAPSASAPAAQATPPTPRQPAFDLRNAGVQSAIRAAAATQGAAQHEQTNDTSASPDGLNMQPIPFRAPRRLHHMDCDSFNCVAYTADNDALYTIPREQYFGVNTDSPRDAWLSCQSGNDLLTTFERYDKCRGISIGLPLQTHGVILDLPKLRL